MRLFFQKQNNILAPVALIASLFSCSMNSPKTLPENFAPWEVIVVGELSEPEKLAAIDLQRYLAQVTGKIPIMTNPDDWAGNPEPAVILGTSDNNPLIQKYGIPDAIDDQGYFLSNAIVNKTPLVIAGGRSPSGAVNAVYGLLRELGFGFYLGSEAIPDMLPRCLDSSPIIKNPAFTFRGVLPWYNFFNSPTAWNPIDHRAFVDQLIRSGANMITFHTYNNEPFAAYEEDGTMKSGAPLLNTASPTWGTQSMMVRDFAFGTDKLYHQEYFGADSTLSGLSADERIRNEKEIMRRALDYAKSRGIYTGLGFEIHGDPTMPDVRDEFIKRLKSLLDFYPSLDFVFLWQEETRGAQGFPVKPVSSASSKDRNREDVLLNYAMHRKEIFKRIVDDAKGDPPFFQDTPQGKIARATEGARLEQFAALAHRILSRSSKSPRLVISGWGGDQRILSAEYYEGLDKLLPDDVAFSSLDHIIPRNRVDAIYHELPSSRLRMPIPWLEFDGDQWQPQPYAHVYEQMLRDIEKSGSQGVLGIHWRTRDVEETFGYLTAYSWNPDLTAKDYFYDLAKRSYDSEHASDMALIHQELDNFGYRWVGGGGQNECANFTWGPGEEEKAVKLESLRDKTLGYLPLAKKGKEKMEWLIAVMDFVLEYRKAEISALRIKELISNAKASNLNQAKILALEAKKLLEKDELANAMRIYAERISTRGEYGVLATMNAKAAIEWKRCQDECRKILNQPDIEFNSGEWNPAPKIILPGFLGSIGENKDLELYLVVFGGKPAFLHYRASGDHPWISVPMKMEKSWIQKASILARHIKPPAIEYGFSFSSDPGNPMAYGPKSVTVMPESSRLSFSPIKTKLEKAELSIEVYRGDLFPAIIKWNDLKEADFYKIYRNDSLIAETCVSMFPDIPDSENNIYYIETWRDGSLLTRSSSVSFSVPDEPVQEQISLRAFTNRAGAFLSWDAVRSFNIKSFRIYRNAADSETRGEKPVCEMKASLCSEHILLDKPPEGKWKYIIVPVNVAGVEGTGSEIVVDFVLGETPDPATDLSLKEMPVPGKKSGSVVFDEQGARFQEGRIEIPHKDEMNLDHGFTLSFDFKAESTDQMPVLICHGFWNVDGWFAQIYQKRLKISAPRGEIFGPVIEPDQWYSVRFIFDGTQLRLQVNGEWMNPQNPVMITPVSAPRALILGGYELNAPEFAFRGFLRNIEMYNDVID
ncbi:hypothetical protein JW926_03470 [Candidatus Sumerlaeota bacterium]|nr:hypothetical protein [Candidatus Sumerlaeota bacterium]